MSGRRSALALVLAGAVVALAGVERAVAAAPPTWGSRMAAAARYAEARSGTISFAVVDEAGRLHGYHGRAAAPAASLLKPMLLVAYLRRPGVRDRPLEQWERDLLGPMIRRSDNTNVPRLVGIVGERRLRRLANAAGMEHFRLHMPYWGSSEVTPRGQALFFDRIDALVPTRHRRYAMRLLSAVVPSQQWGVGGVPHGDWHLYFKGGWSTGTGLVDHQVALYAAGGERFSLALFTRFDPDHDYGKETLRGLAERLLHGVASPERRLQHASRAAVGRHFAITATSGCGIVRIQPLDGEVRTVATGASSCAGFRLASAGPRALWSWPQGGAARLATASYGTPVASDLGTFGSSDPLGALAGGGTTLAYEHGATVTMVGGPDCPASPDAVLAAGAGRVATASGSAVEVRDATTCALERSLTATGTVTALAIGDDLAASLSRGSGGRLWLERFRVATGALLGKQTVRAATLPRLAVRGSWTLLRTPHALQLVRAGSDRSWTVWRPVRAPVSAGLSLRRILWIEDGHEGARLWSLRLPAGA